MKEIQQGNQLVATWLAAPRLHTASWASCVSTTHQWRLRIKFINCQWREIKNKQTSCTGSAFPRNKTKEDRFNLHTHCPMAHSDLRNVFWTSRGCPYCLDRIHAASIMPSQSLCELIQQHPVTARSIMLDLSDHSDHVPRGSEVIYLSFFQSSICCVCLSHLRW